MNEHHPNLTRNPSAGPTLLARIAGRGAPAPAQRRGQAIGEPRFGAWLRALATTAFRTGDHPASGGAMS